MLYAKPQEVTITHREQSSPTAIFLGYLVLGLVLVMLIPTVVLIITKDARPGDSLYPYKLQIESAGLSLVRGTSLEGPLQKLILGRRLEEKKL